MAFEIVPVTLTWQHNQYVTLGLDISADGSLNVYKASGSGTANNPVVCYPQSDTYSAASEITKIDIPQATGTYDMPITVWWDNQSGAHADHNNHTITYEVTGSAPVKKNVNKVVLSNGTTLLDLTSDTVDESHVLQGYTFHKADGTSATGTASGGSGITVESLSVTQNGTYTAPSGQAYSPVIVDVPTGSTKNVQVAAGMARLVNKTSMTASGVQITVSKSGNYKCSWMHYAAAAGTAQYNYSTQLYKNNSTIGSSTYCPIYNNATASNFLVSYTTTLNEGDSLEIRGRTRSGSTYYTVCGMLMIEEQ